MDIAELLAETEQLKKKHLETAQKLAETRELLARIALSLTFPHHTINFLAIKEDIEKVLK